MRLFIALGISVLVSGLALGGVKAQLLGNPADGSVSIDAGQIAGDTLSGLGLGGTTAGVSVAGTTVSVGAGTGDSGGGISVSLNSGGGGSGGSDSGSDTGPGNDGGTAATLRRTTGGDSGGGTAAVTVEDQLLRLDRLIRSRGWQRLAGLNCSADVEVVRLSSWLGRQGYARLPGTMARNAGEIGRMQDALSSDPDLSCLLDQGRTRADRVVATDYRNGNVILMVI